MPQSRDPAGTRIGVMGGTFDPIHLGHLVAASEALHAFGLDRVLFIPASDPWQKEAETPAEDRFMMTSLGIGDYPHFEASRLELDRKGPTYTADSLESLQDFLGEAIDLFLITGADAVLNLNTWKKLDRVRELAEVIAMTRPNFNLESFRQTEDLPRVHIQEMPGIDISATDIRERVRQDRPIDFLVPREVAWYIRRHGLYTDQVTDRSA